MCAGAGVFVLAIAAGMAKAQDAVIVIGSDGKTPVTRQGQIIDYTGTELRLKTAAGREEPIPAARVLEVKTEWVADHLQGIELQKSGKLAEAIRGFQQAKEREPRAWARRQIMAELTSCYAESGRFDQAGDEFLAIVAGDPATRHLAVMPLAWRPFPPDAALESRAAAWLSSGAKTPAASLLGASWLLSTSRRAEAIAALEQLAVARGKGEDTRLASLADVQLWRTKLVTAKPDEVARWKAAVVQMPAEIRACGWFVIGEALARQGQPEEAALAYLRVPLIHGQQRVMAADALVAAGKQLESLKRTQQAAGLYREVLSDYAACPAATEASSRLKMMADKP
jgi:tetratricopeptide (TPR) repeat protein